MIHALIKIILTVIVFVKRGENGNLLACVLRKRFIPNEKKIVQIALENVQVYLLTVTFNCI